MRDPQHAPSADSASGTRGEAGPSFPTCGILGGGQLARMTAEAAMRLGVRTRFYQRQDSGPMSPCADVITGAWDDDDALRRFVEGCDVVTLDNEWVQLDTLVKLLPEGVPLWPSLETMALVSDKGRQKDHARELGLPLGPYRICTGEAQALEAARELGYPMVAKRPQHSYDGYGNRTVHDDDGLRAALRDLGGTGGYLLLESFVEFVRELAVMVARRPGGQDVAYPVTVTVQRDHRCEAVEVPAPGPPEVIARATELARRAAKAYGCVGVVGVEMFELPDGTVLLNEIAPRPHNSGHYTIDACVTSQFENHLRAVLDLPLGSPALVRPAAVMVNVLGGREGSSSASSLASALEVPGASLHLYGKHQVRTGRKMGHVTATAETIDEARRIAYEAAGRLDL